ncbi:hypothetical protein [Halolactibacillus halophilus]|uniref:hypothetical protein n=1 Tax=Halolactibacillus halophilus TaxID=306540 RepID=UPI00135628D7|nr:hypothetical protein [Halolactibacillus halophilus]
MLNILSEVRQHLINQVKHEQLSISIIGEEYVTSPIMGACQNQAMATTCSRL